MNGSPQRQQRLRLPRAREILVLNEQSGRAQKKIMLPDLYLSRLNL
jgi:hypothetical protein